MSCASNATVSTARRPASRSSSASVARSALGVARREHDVRGPPRHEPAQRRRARCRSPPPSTSTDCTDPNASFMRAFPSVAAVRAGRGGGGGRTGGRPSGSTRARSSREAVEVGVHRRRAARAAAASPWPGRRGRRRRRRARRARRAARPSPGTPAGMSSASVQPGCGNDSGPGLPGPKRLSTARNDAARASLSISTERRTASCAS